MILVVNKYLLGKGFSGMTIYPFVIVRNKSLAKNPVFINHERIHLRQQLELLILPFYLWYGCEFVYKALYYKSFMKGYTNLSFEREAYANEKNFNYCTNRKVWNFTRYLNLEE